MRCGDRTLDWEGLGDLGAGLGFSVNRVIENSLLPPLGLISSCGKGGASRTPLRLTARNPGSLGPRVLVC